MRYAQVETFFWHDEKLRGLSEDGRYLFLYLLTSPHGNMLGIFYLPEMYAASDLQWELIRYRRGIDTLSAAGIIAVDNSVVWLKNYLKYNPLKGPKQITGAVKKIAEIPGNALMIPFMQGLGKFMTEDDFVLFRELYADMVAASCGASDGAGDRVWDRVWDRVSDRVSDRVWDRVWDRVCDTVSIAENREQRTENRNREQKQRTVTETGTGTGTESRETSDPARTVPHEEIVGLFNKICRSLPRVEKLTEKRREKLRVLWRYRPGLDVFQSLFTKAEESDFLSGRNGKWGGCGFDWLVNLNNAVKVLEGNYKNNSPGVPANVAAALRLVEKYEREEEEGGEP